MNSYPEDTKLKNSHDTVISSTSSKINKKHPLHDPPLCTNFCIDQWKIMEKNRYVATGPTGNVRSFRMPYAEVKNSGPTRRTAANFIATRWDESQHSSELQKSLAM